MKRIGFVLSLLLLVVAPSLASASPVYPCSEAVDLSELPWSTVSAVLKKVADQGQYAYSSLELWYGAGLLTVTQNAAGGYEVRICDADGILDVILVDHL